MEKNNTDLAALNAPFLPMFSRPSRSPSVTRGGTIYYPISLATAISYAQNQKYKCVLIDSVTEDHSRKQTVELIKKLNPRVVAIDTSTPSIYNDISIAEEIQRVLPNSKVVLVGRHVTYAPTESLKFCNNVKIVARREPYPQLIELLEGKSLSEIKGVSYKESGKIIHNKDAKLVPPEEFGFISQVYKEFLNIRKYFYASCFYPYIHLQAGWGCKFNCSFCNEVVKANYRHRSVEHVIEELKYIKKELPEVKEILWDDPTFVIDENFICELCNAMMDNKIDLHWSCATRADISLETLSVMKKSGARVMHIGLESTTQEALNAVHKGILFEKEVEYLENCKRAGILNHSCWIIGLPSDTKESIKKTIEISKTLPSLDTVQIFPLIPTPFEDVLNKESEGTTWKFLVENNYIITKDYSKWLKPNGLYSCVISYPWLSNEEIEKLVEEFYRKWYFRLGYFAYKFKQSLFSWHNFQRNLKAFRTMVSR